ncbi:MAG: amino acid permease [Lentisphaeria bacterium]|nr:amino acid permease [Lentisphaeria bacterium]
MAERKQGYQFNTFSGVFLPSILTILGVVMFMRLGTIVGELGVLGALGILLFAESIAVATGLSISAISTNTPVQSGGPYFLISRALGPGFGSAIGLTYYVSQSLSVPFYIIGFTEATITYFPGLAPYTLWVSLIPLLTLFAIAMIGANWAIRTQYVIFFVLGISILAIFAAALGAPPDSARFLDTLHAMPGKKVDILILAASFAVFFPAVTGFLAGVNMSGDLEDPRKSIPRGTMSAITVGFVIYAAEIMLFGAAWPREDLTASAYGTLVRNALFHTGFLIFAGMAAATLSSALGTLIGAPRILQAFAADRIFKPLNPFSRGRGQTNEPVPAMILTLIISAAVIFFGTYSKGNALNIVAKLVTMFTLCTYAIINISAAVEDYASNPSFRPHFRLFHYLVGCYGAVACFAAALFIDALLLLVAFAIVSGLFLLARRQSLRNTFGDARRGYYFEHIRRDLIALDAMPADAKNWRPQILILASGDKKHRTLIQFGSLLNNDRGILAVARILESDEDGPSREKARRAALREMRHYSVEIGTPFFPTAVITPGNLDFDDALNVFLQSRSLGPLTPNIVISGWPVNPDRVEAFFRNLQTIRLLRMNSLLLLNPERAEDTPSGPIDIWWRGKRNGSLMLILAHLLNCNRKWQKVPIRLLRIASEEQHESAEAELLQLSEDARIEARRVVLDSTGDFQTTFRTESAKASVIFLGFIPPEPEDSAAFHDRISRLLDGMPTAFLAASAGDTDIDS